VLLRLLIAALFAIPAFADWTEYRSGPFHIFTDAGDKAGREALTRLEQLRFVLGAQIGKQELTTIFPLNLVLFSNQKAYAPYVLPKVLTEGGSATLAAWTADAALPQDLLRAVTQRLLDENAGRMPDELETALQDLFCTIQVNATRVALGAPPPANSLPPERARAWAKLQMMVTQPEFSGKLRIYLNNLQQAGEEDTASRNAFNLTASQLAERADQYFKAGRFEAAPAIGKALNPNRDFIEKEVPKTTMDALLTELKGGGKAFPPESPRDLLRKNTVPSLELAIRANPKWAEPQFAMAALETDPARKIGRLKMAASLDPRNTGYWRNLAEAQGEAGLFADAEKSWAAAERAAANASERAKIHQAKLDLQERRVDADIAARQRAREEEARELQRIKDEAAAEVRAAERAANERLGASAGNVKGAVPWFGDPTGAKVSGTLTRVDCLAAGSMRLTIQQATGIPIKLLIRDPKQLTVATDSGEAQFVCGAQRTPRKIEVQHNSMADAKSGTVGDVLVVKFP
jgi:hypothetical protein